VDGVRGKALSFDGVDSYVEIPTLQNPSTSDWATEAWIKTTNPSSGVIITKRHEENQKSLTLHIGSWAGVKQNNGLSYFSDDESNYEVGAVGTTNIADGEWHHLVGIRKGLNFYIYVDGNLEGQNNIKYGNFALNDITSSNKWQIGHSGAWNEYFDGLIDEVRIYNRALTAEEVKEQYDDGGLPNTQILNLLPVNGSRLGSTEVQFSWRTSSDSSTNLYLKSEDENIYAHYSDNSGKFHSINRTLTRNKWYYYYVSSGSATSENRSFYIDNGIEFSKKSYNFTIERDYSQLVSVSVRNTDSSPHSLLVSTNNPYNDLILGFIGNGSQDQEIMLNPGENKDIALSIFAQDAMLSDYRLQISLNATDSSVFDYAMINLKIRQPNINYTVTEITADPYTLTKTFRVNNNGDPITDFSIFAEGELANKVLFKPAISHANVGSGESFTFKLVPFIESNAPITGLINATGAGKYKTIEVNFSQSGGKTKYTSVLSNVTICMGTNSWYCTNNPDITNTLYLPPGLDSSDVKAAVLAINFSLPWNAADYRNHNVNISLNGHPVKSLIDTIPNGLYLIAIDPSYLNYGSTGTSANTIEIDTKHLNGGHYVVATGIELRLKLNELTTSLFADSQDQADIIAKNMDFLCDKCVPKTEIVSIEAFPASGQLTVSNNQNITFNISVKVKNTGSGVLQVEVYKGNSLITKSFKDVAGSPDALENFTISFQAPNAAGAYDYKILTRFREAATGELTDGDFCDVRDQITYKINVVVPDIPSELNQNKSDGTTQITVGGATDERTVVFSARVSDPDSDRVGLQIELRRLDENNGQFDETLGGLKTSDLVLSGSEVTITVNDLIDANYHWRARAIDENGNVGQWQEFGVNLILQVDFIVEVSTTTPTPTPITISIVTPVDNSLETGLVNFKGNANGGTPPYIYTWTSNIDGTLRTTAPTISTSDEFNNAPTLGKHDINFRVQDSTGNVQIQTITLNVVISAPDIYIIPVNYKSYNPGFVPDSDLSKVVLEERATSVMSYYLHSSYNALYLNFKPPLDTITLPESQSYYESYEEKNVVNAQQIKIMRDVNEILKYPKYSQKYSQIGGATVVIVLNNIQRMVPYTYIKDLDRPYILVYRDNNYGTWAHEVGHTLGRANFPLPDLYPTKAVHGTVWWWDIMGLGPQVNPPTQHSSFDKLIVGWLSPKEVGKEKNKDEDVILTPVEKSKYGDPAYIYKSSNTLSYIIEARELPPGNVINYGWDSLIGNDGTLENGVVIYKVENLDLLGTMETIPDNWKINNLQGILSDLIPSNLGIGKDDPTLFDGNMVYIDYWHFVKFGITSVSTTPYYQPTVRISPCGVLCEFSSGVLMDSNSLSTSSGGASFSTGNGTAPDLDLHAVTPDGKHIGMNYTSGEYEMQIQGGVSSGDLVGGEEWIFVHTRTEVRYFVDSHDVQKFLEENPDVDPANATINYSTTFMEYGENPQRLELPDGNWTVTNRTVSEPQNDIIEPGVIKEIVLEPPASIINLAFEAGATWLNFTWLNPPDPDFSHVLLFLNGAFLTNVTAPQNYYNFTGLSPDTEYELGTHTVDTSGNINQTWVNATAKTTFSTGIKGDLNGNGDSADAGDLVLMKRASIGEIQADSRYDLNNNGQNADAGDLVLMKRASIGEITL
jgi:M6 family metalloprotease-like protein